MVVLYNEGLDEHCDYNTRVVEGVLAMKFVCF